MMREAERLATEVRGRLAAQFAQPNYRQRMVATLKNVRDELTRRDLEKLMKNLEAYDKKKIKQGRKPTKRRRR